MGSRSRIQVKPAAVKIDGDLEMISVPEPIGTFLYRCNLGVQTLHYGVGESLQTITGSSAIHEPQSMRQLLLAGSKNNRIA